MGARPKTLVSLGVIDAVAEDTGLLTMTFVTVTLHRSTVPFVGPERVMREVVELGGIEQLASTLPVLERLCVIKDRVS